MVKKILFLLSCIILVLLNSCSNPKAVKNEQNLKKIKVNMTISQVNAIMGKPDTVLKMPNLFAYRYESFFLSSDDFYIFFDTKDSLVTSINNGL